MDIFTLLKRFDNIQKMINFSKNNKPALAATIMEIEEHFWNQTTFDLRDDFCKQCIGAMVKVILEPFGYQSTKQKDMPRGVPCNVKSASVYEKLTEPRLKLVQVLSIEKVSLPVQDENHR